MPLYLVSGFIKQRANFELIYSFMKTVGKTILFFYFLIQRAGVRLIP